MDYVKEYASAFFELVLEKGQVDEAYETFKVIVNEVKEHPSFVKLLSHPHLPKEEKKAIIDRVFGSVLTTLKHFLYVLIDRNRFDAIEEIFVAFEQLYHQYKAVLEVVAFTKDPLTEELKEKLNQLLAQKYGKKVHLINRIDPSLLGGIRLLVDGVEIDFSLSSQLSRLKQQILKSL